MPSSGPTAPAPYGATPSPYGTTPSPYGTTPNPFGTGSTASPSPWGSTAPPYGGYPAGQQPQSLFPNGMFNQPPNGSQPPLRLFDNPRLRETWIYGDGGSQLQINDIETGVTVALPNFLGGTKPLLFAPNFALHLWDGPQPPAHTQFLPGNAYSAYLEIAYNTDHAQALGVDLSGSVGVFTDFDTFTTDSIRLQTYSYGWARLTPTMMLKLGVNYLDRVDIKILPIIGVLWEPNPRTRYDIVFPRPKLAHMLSTVGGTDFWWYIAGEYGGGSWTINNGSTGFADQVDINDIRLMLGLEWVSQNGLHGNFEVGWVTSRQLRYHFNPADNTSLSDSFMLRGGIAF